MVGIDCIRCATFSADEQPTPITIAIHYHNFMARVTPRITYDKSFGMLLETAAGLLVRARRDDDDSVAQAALLYSALLLESAANCCLWSLKLSSAFTADLDKLPTFSKLDLYLLLRSRGRKKLDRGSRHFQDAAELKALRDLAVHPKQARMTSHDWDDNLGGTSSYDYTERLKISRSSAGWTVQDATTAFLAVNTFLEHFFLTACAMTQKETRFLLLAETGPDADMTDIFIFSQELEYVAKHIKIPLRYVSIVSTRARTH